MKALLLLGGKGTRLRPITNEINKHQIRLGSYTLAEHALNNITTAGITDIVVTSQSDYIIPFAQEAKIEHPDINITPVITNGIGIAGEIKQCANQLGESDFVVVFGDVLFEKAESLKGYIDQYKASSYKSMILLGKAKDPSRHATPFFEGDKVVRIEEKCQNYPHNNVVLTWDIFPAEALELVNTLKPSDRGELEISDLRNLMIQNFNVGYGVIDGWWIDAGIPEDLLKANRLILERDFPQSNFVATNNASVINSNLSYVTLDDSVTIKNCELTNSIILGNTTLNNQTLENTIIYNDISLTAEAT